ncbi:hypothetical protein DASB73_014880 [Starmerella bacillaris]|uniref:Uncharacterized protein n=1 Tax=Starmerella bacillaris TaxID=1247836 RepID=A0AAV5RG81_STABA|nr:hypothetical protein DASB73_014880 [Starmerella bacillaris]
MGIAPSKFAIAEKLSELSEKKEIPDNDDIWDSLLSPLASGVEATDGEFYALANIELVRKIRDKQPGNFIKLLQKISERLEGLLRSQAVGSQGVISSQICHCCRLITRMFPLVYEEEAQEVYDQVWKNAFSDQSGIGPSIIDSLRTLIHFHGFSIAITLPKDVSKVWETGVGCSVAEEHSVNYCKQRIYVVTALINVLSEPMYTLKHDYISLQYWSTTTTENAIFCSLLNWSLHYSYKLRATDDKYTLSVLCLELILISVTYQTSGNEKNRFSNLLSRICQQKDIEWILTKVCEGLNQRSTVVLWASFLWEFISQNRHVYSLEKLADCSTTIMKLATMKDDTPLTRLASFILLTLSRISPLSAEKIGPSILEYLYANRDNLSVLEIESATFIDTLWNCAPYMDLTQLERTEFNELLKVPNKEVSEYLSTILSLTKNSLSEDKGNADVVWEPVEFSWNKERRRWYLTIIYGNVYKTNLRIYAKTEIVLFKVEETPKLFSNDSPAEALHSASELATDVMKSATSFLGR